MKSYRFIGTSSTRRSGFQNSRVQIRYDLHLAVKNKHMERIGWVDPNADVYFTLTPYYDDGYCDLKKYEFKLVKDIFGNVDKLEIPEGVQKTWVQKDGHIRLPIIFGTQHWDHLKPCDPKTPFEYFFDKGILRFRFSPRLRQFQSSFLKRTGQDDEPRAGR